MGISSALRNFFDPPEFRGLPVAPHSGWDALELNGRSVEVRLVKAAAPPAYEAASLIDLGRSGSLAWTDAEITRLIRESFRISGIVFRCLTIIADAFAEGVLRVVRDVDGKPEPIADHPLRLLISEPNPEQSEAEFWTTLLLTMGVNGYGLVEKVRSRSDEVVQLYPRNPETHRRKVNDAGEVVWEQRAKGRLVRTIPDRDMIVVPYQFDTGYSRLGVAPVQVLSREIGIDTNLSAFLKLFLDEGGVPPFVLVSKDPIADEAEIDAIQEKWVQKYGGGRSWGRLPVLHGGYELKEIGTDLDKMAWPDLRGVNELRIAQGFGVPAHLIGAREAIANGGLATTEVAQAMRLLQLYTIAPLRARVDGAFTRGLLREHEADRTVYLQFDTSQVLALQEDEDKKATRLRADAQAGMVTLEEFRRERGYEERPANGETYLRPFSVVEVVAGAAVEQATDPTPTNPPAPPAKSDRRYRDLKALSPAALSVRASLLSRNRKAQGKLTEIGDRALRKFFKAQGERIAAEARKSAGGVATKAVDTINWDEEERLLTEVLQRFYHTAGELAAEDAAAATGVSLSWDLANPNISRTMTQLAKRVTGISETTRLEVAKTVSDALQEGVSMDQLAERLATQFEETYRGRAMVIARTESMHSFNVASVTSYQESGVVSSVEIADNPDHTDDYGASDGLTCAERNGLVVSLADAQQHIDAEHPSGTMACLPVLDEG